jgi:hypothetical protein
VLAVQAGFKERSARPAASERISPLGHLIASPIHLSWGTRRSPTQERYPNLLGHRLKAGMIV